MKLSDKYVPWVAAVTLLLMFGLALSSLKDDSPTFDEQGFLVRGLAYLRGEDNGGKRDIRVGHPLGLNALNASLLVNDPTVRLPSDHPSWQETSFHRPAELFLWEIGNDVGHIMFLARLPTVWLGMLLAAVGCRWSTELSSGWRMRRGRDKPWSILTGLLALVLLAFDPNILAHTRYVTTDLGLAAAAALAGFSLWRFVRVPDWRSALIAGAALGLLLNTKFTSLLFLPLFAVVIAAGFLGLRREETFRRRSRLLGTALSVYPAAAFLVLWAGHGFQSAPLQATLPVVQQFGGASVPLQNYLDQLLDISHRLEVSTPSFLLGNYSDSGWWYYFPVAFVLKTPLPVLLLLLWSFIRVFYITIRQRNRFKFIWFDLVALLVPAVGFFGIALTTTINLGYRHLLPILPFLYVLVAVVVVDSIAKSVERWRKLKFRFAFGLAAWFIVVSVAIYPHYLAFFNLLAGGPDNGWQALVDSNLDWGQDLARLGQWQSNEKIQPLWLSYFGEARPEYYGIDYVGLDSFSPRLMNPDARPFYPHDPSPGWYAISATTLQGVHFADHDQFRFFREKEPVGKIGYSIFLYEQPARGDPVNLLLGDVQLDEIEAEDYVRFGTNDVLPRWINPQQAIILPDDARPAWLAIGHTPLNPLFSPYVESQAMDLMAPENAYILSPIRLRPQESGEINFEFQLDDGNISFAGSPLLEVSGDQLKVITTWRQNAGPQPVKIFVHLLDPAGAIMMQWDGLGVVWEGWRAGDTLVQIHELPVDAVPPGEYRVVTGVYDPESLRRWLSPSGTDVIELGLVTIP